MNFLISVCLFSYLLTPYGASNVCVLVPDANMSRICSPVAHSTLRFLFVTRAHSHTFSWLCGHVMSLGWSVKEHGAPNSKYTQCTLFGFKRKHPHPSFSIKFNPFVNIDVGYWMFLRSENGTVSGFCLLNISLFLFYFMFYLFGVLFRKKKRKESITSGRGWTPGLDFPCY